MMVENFIHTFEKYCIAWKRFFSRLVKTIVRVSSLKVDAIYFNVVKTLVFFLFFFCCFFFFGKCEMYTMNSFHARVLRPFLSLIFPAVLCFGENKYGRRHSEPPSIVRDIAFEKTTSVYTRGRVNRKKIGMIKLSSWPSTYNCTDTAWRVEKDTGKKEKRLNVGFFL